MNSIILTTTNAKTESSHKLRLNLTDDLRLSNNLIALGKCTLYYNWKNITAKYNNNRFDIAHIATGTLHSTTIPDGSYSVRDINNFVHHTMNLLGYANSDDTYDINIYANSVSNRVTITVSNKFRFSMYDGLAETLGFDSSQRSLSGTEANGLLVPQIEKVNEVFIHCNLVDNRVTHKSTVLYSFTPDKAFGNLLTITPNFPEYCFCRNASFSYIEIELTDQDENPLDVEDAISVKILVKDKKI